MRNQRGNIGNRPRSKRWLDAIGLVGLCAASVILSNFITTRAWADNTTTETQQVLSMHLLTPNTGWVAGQKNLLRTSDAGQHWTDITPPVKALGNIDSVFFLNDLQGWVVNSTTGAVRRDSAAFIVSSTSDGGQTWASRPLTAPRVEGSTPISIDFADAQHGWMMLRLPSSSNFSFGLLLATSDGGITWTVLPKPPIGDAISFISSTTGWLAGGAAHDELYVTRNGGQSWQRQYVSPPAASDNASTPIYQLPTFSNDHDGNIAIFVGGSTKSQLTVYDTHDAGATWSSHTTVPMSADANGAVTSIVNADTLFVAPRNREALTAITNGTQRTNQQFFSNLSPDEAVTALNFKDDRQGWVLTASGHCDNGKSGCHQESRLLATTDGGSTLSDITPSIASASTVQPEAVVTTTGTKGFDQCAAGTVSQMQAWWSNTPWSFANIYIGGSNRGCSQGNLTSSWVTSIFNQGWVGLVPTWVGAQAPASSCTGCGKISTNTTTARQQGVSEADSATNAASALGLSPATIIYYDMEQYNGSPSGAVQAFVEGWVTELHARGNKAGVYGSGADAANDWAVIANPPDAVWIANWNGSTSVFGLSGLPDSDWSTHQRLHQYEGGHNETWGGVTFNIDSDSADGPIAHR